MDNLRNRNRLTFLDEQLNLLSLDPSKDPPQPPTSQELAAKRTILAGNRTILAGDRTEWAERRTEWAEKRTIMANKRTFLSYIRTAITIATLAKNENVPIFAVIGIIFVSMALIDYVYTESGTIVLKEKKAFDKVMYFLQFVTPFLIAIVSLVVLGFYS